MAAVGKAERDLIRRAVRLDRVDALHIRVGDGIWVFHFNIPFCVKRICLYSEHRQRLFLLIQFCKAVLEISTLFAFPKTKGAQIGKVCEKRPAGGFSQMRSQPAPLKMCRVFIILRFADHRKTYFSDRCNLWHLFCILIRNQNVRRRKECRGDHQQNRPAHDAAEAKQC